MAGETLDVVSEQDEVVGRETREVVHKKKLLHREIAVLIYDTQRRILIQQRSSHKKAMPLYWMISVAGHVTAGKTPEQTAHKELVEELGFDTKLKFYTKELLDYGFERHFTYWYIGKIPAGVTPAIDKHETEQIRWLSEQELDQMIEDGEEIEEFSLRDFRKFFKGDFDQFF